MGRLGFFLTPMPQLDPMSVELRQTGNFRMLYRLSYRAAASLNLILDGDAFYYIRLINQVR